MGKGSVITVRVSMSEKALIDETARGRNMSLSNFIRQAVLSYVVLGEDELDTATAAYRIVAKALTFDDLLNVVNNRAKVLEEAFLELLEGDLK